ncbi:MAG: SusD/RagB family nutrient-binding outer membrane lipoprotein, partial [Alistipes sp.]|nr:SusD/RagB family nutrient-binding outer membrane lipoprotein [Alistipes sp.]
KGNRDPYKAASNLNISQSDPMLIMSAAESYFLKAECAVRGWNMGNSAQNLYEQGIKVSMQEHGVEIGNYLEGTTAPASYSDNIGSNSQSNPSSITVKWNEGDSNDQKYERILVQKWLANFPNGWETWTDRRRTGYPRFFRPVTTMGSSAGLNDIMRRLPYPESEYLTNSENVAAAVQMIGGSDSYGTKLWWVTQ